MARPRSRCSEFDDRKRIDAPSLAPNGADVRHHEVALREGPAERSVESLEGGQRIGELRASGWVVDHCLDGPVGADEREPDLVGESVGVLQGRVGVVGDPQPQTGGYQGGPGFASLAVLHGQHRRVGP